MLSAEGLDPGGSGGIGHAGFTFLNGEPTLYAFSREDVANARRNTYQADESGVVFAVTFVNPQLLKPFEFNDVAGSWAWIWDQNAKVPHVLDIAEDQRVKPLGGVEDVVEVAIESSSGRSSATVVFTQDQVMPEAFAAAVAAEVADLDAIEGR